MFFTKAVCISILFVISAFKIRESNCTESCLPGEGENLYSFCGSFQDDVIKYYIDCMSGKGYDVKAFMKICAEQMNLPVELKSFCDPDNKQRSIDADCCTLLEAAKQQPDKGKKNYADNVPICVNEMIQKSKTR